MEDICVELGGHSRRLFIGLKASKALSRASGRGLIHLNNMLAEFDVPTLEMVLWAGLSEDEPTITQSLVAKRVEAYFESEKTLFPLFMAAGKAINDSGMFNQAKEETVQGNQKTATES